VPPPPCELNLGHTTEYIFYALQPRVVYKMVWKGGCKVFPLQGIVHLMGRYYQVLRFADDTRMMDEGTVESN